MLQWITDVVDSAGYWGIVLMMFLENIFPPIPSEVIMPFAGFMAAQGTLGLAGVVAAGTAGSVLGALPLYYLGRFVGEKRLAAWTDRHGQWLALSGADIRKAGEWFDRHGSKTVLFCRLVPGVRSLISIPAGVSGMPMLPFLLYTALGTAVWSSLLAYAGYLLGENYGQVERWLAPIAAAVLGLIAIGLLAWLIKRRAHARRQRRTSAS